MSDDIRRLRWRLQELLHRHGAQQPVTAADELLDLVVNELLSSAPGSAANRIGNDLRREVDSLKPATHQ